MKSEQKRRARNVPKLPSAIWRTSASIMVLGLALGASTGVYAQPKSVNIPAQSLDKALAELGTQTGLQVLYGPELVRGKKSSAVVGDMEPAQALETLLKGAGLQYRIENNTVFLSNDAGSGSALELGATNIQGQGMGEMTENSGSYTTGLVSAGSKTPTSIRQTPQSVSVVTHQLIEDQRMTDLADAMKVAPGVTVQKSNYRLSSFYSRGFQIQNIQIDGAAPMALGTTAGSFYSNKSYDLVEFDHVEVLRGASGLFGGTGDPGGIINLVRKRPLDTYQLNVDTSAGSWDNYRTQVDVTGPLGFDGKLRGRLVTAYTDKQSFQDHSSTEKPLIYGILEADLTDSTRLTLGGRSERIHENGNGSDLPRYTDGSDIGLKRSTNLTSKWAYLDGRSQEVFAKIDHELNDDWKVNLSYTQTLESGFSKVSSGSDAVDPVTLRGAHWYGSSSAYRSDQKLWDVNLSGKFDMFDLTHEFLVGMDYQKITSQWRGTNQLAGAFGDIDVFDPDSTPWNQPATDKNYIRNYDPNSQTQYGLYSTLRLQLADPLHLIIGARAQRYKFDQLYTAFNSGTGSWQVASDISAQEPTKVVPFGGLVYDLDDQWSTYVSYSEIFNPQQNKMAGPGTGTPIEEPMTGKTYETGIKGELWGGKVNTSAAIYYTERENEAIQDPRYPPSFAIFGGSCCYVAQGKVVSKGIDLEVTGEVLPNWMVIAGYNYNNNKNVTGSSIYSSITPKHNAKLWSTFKLSGVMSDLTVGGGVNVQSATFVSGDRYINPADPSETSSYKFKQSGYAIWGAMAEYKIDDHWTVAYNINNIFDKVYYSTVGTADGGNYYGEPRNQMVTLRGKFW